MLKTVMRARAAGHGGRLHGPQREHLGGARAARVGGAPAGQPPAAEQHAALAQQPGPGLCGVLTRRRRHAEEPDQAPDPARGHAPHQQGCTHKQQRQVPSDRRAGLLGEGDDAAATSQF